jgi:chemotaxis protein CheD
MGIASPNSTSGEVSASGDHSCDQWEYVKRANVVIGLSEMHVSGNPDDVIATYALGSCLGIAIYDPIAKVGGMMHGVLPLAKIDPNKAKKLPCTFIDTGLTALLKEAQRMGAKRERLVIKIAGCSQLMDQKGVFKIGQRNYTVMRKLLWKNGLLIAAENVGGTSSRTLFLDIGTGAVILRMKGRELPL